LLVTEVMEKTYPLADGSGHMKIATTVCDSGGKEGVTGNAYLFYMRLKKKGLAERFFLCKGDSNPNAPRVRIEFPDSDRKDRLAKARGEVPVMMFNPNMLKDTLNGMLPSNEETDRVKHDKAPEINVGRITFPSWLPDSFFEELTVEVRTPKGWENKHSRRNESWDLAYYCLGLCTFRRLDHVNWKSPPPWLSDWPANPLVVLSEKTSAPRATAVSRTLASLGESLA
jgi:phage terminase large subunit GpA-like protein